MRACVREAAERAGRQPEEITILAATKYLTPADMPALVQAGITDLAENRLESLAEKQAAVETGSALSDPARWHFIGELQSRKVAQIAGLVDCIHTLCSSSAAGRLARIVEDAGEIPDLMVQVNISEDPVKHGLLPHEVAQFLDELPASLCIAGFMTMPAFVENAEENRGAFAALHELVEQERERFAGRHTLRWLSMGTSQDFAVAVEEGATHVRLGRILYAEQE